MTSISCLMKSHTILVLLDTLKWLKSMAENCWAATYFACVSVKRTTCSHLTTWLYSRYPAAFRNTYTVIQAIHSYMTSSA